MHRNCIILILYTYYFVSKISKKYVYKIHFKCPVYILCSFLEKNNILLSLHGPRLTFILMHRDYILRTFSVRFFSNKNSDDAAVFEREAWENQLWAGNCHLTLNNLFPSFRPFREFLFNKKRIGGDV